MLSLAGGAVGLILAALSLQLLVSVGKNFIPRVDDISLDPSVLVFTLGISIVSGLILGIVPALQASMHVVNEALKDSSRDSTSDRSRNRVRGALLISEIAVSFVLLIVTTLLDRQLRAHPQRAAGLPRRRRFRRLHRAAAGTVSGRKPEVLGISTRACSIACRKSRAQSRSR